MLGVQYMYMQEKFVLINVYAPNNDDPHFWLTLLKYYEYYDGHRNLMGDFNFALNPVIDRSKHDAKNNE